MNNVVENLILPRVLVLDPFDPFLRLRMSRVCKWWREIVKKHTFHHLWPTKCIYTDFPPPDGPENVFYKWQRQCHAAFSDIKWWEKPQFVVFQAPRRSGRTHILIELMAQISSLGQYYTFKALSKRHLDYVEILLSQFKSTRTTNGNALFKIYDDIDHQDEDEAINLFKQGHHVIVTCLDNGWYRDVATHIIGYRE